MNDEKNFSTIPSSYTPKDYRRARFAANMGDADLPIPSFDELNADKTAATKK
jgi:hypothetical protein